MDLVLSIVQIALYSTCHQPHLAIYNSYTTYACVNNTILKPLLLSYIFGQALNKWVMIPSRKGCGLLLQTESGLFLR